VHQAITAEKNPHLFPHLEAIFMGLLPIIHKMFHFSVLAKHLLASAEPINLFCEQGPLLIVILKAKGEGFLSYLHKSFSKRPRQ
jgi:hypothetical protein